MSEKIIDLNQDLTDIKIRDSKGNVCGLVREELKGKRWWVPPVGTTAWFVNVDCCVYPFVKDACTFDEQEFNCFQTAEDARLHRDFVRATVEAMAREAKKGDWWMAWAGSIGVVVTPSNHTGPTFPTEEEAKAYADLRARAKKMYERYLV